MSRAFLRVLVAALATAPAAARAQAVIFSHEANVLEANAGKLAAPEAVACTDRALVVGDTGNGRLLLYAVKEGRVSGGSEVRLPQLSTPRRVQLDSRGNVLVLDGKSHQVLRVAANGTFGGFVVPPGRGREELGVGSFKLDGKDNVYLLEVRSRRVLVLDAEGALARELPLPKGGTFTDLTVDGVGTVYALDSVGSGIWVAEKGAPAFRPLATNLKERMNFATTITLHKGRLFLVDRHGNGVVLFGIDGSYLGRQLSIGWATGLVYYPGDLCLAPDGTAYVADTLNNRVQVFTTGSK